MSEHEVELSLTDWVRGQTQTILETGTTAGIEVRGAPIVLLTLRGARTGKLRYTPVMRVEHDGHYAVVASKGGAPENSVWFENIVAHPDISLQDGTETRQFTARVVSGEERAQWWERAVAAFPNYAEYATKTDREIPVFVLDPR